MNGFSNFFFCNHSLFHRNLKTVAPFYRSEADQSKLILDEIGTGNIPMHRGDLPEAPVV